jgi:hypothetical protein
VSESKGWAVAIALVVVIVLLNVLSVRHKSLTQDEPLHFRYGLSILGGNAERFMDGTMPVSALNAIPQKAAGLMTSEEVRGLLGRVETGRYVTIAFSLLTALYVFKWSRELYGSMAGLVSLALYAFCPNIIAHSRLITTDVYAAGMVLISTYYFWKFLKHGGWRLGMASAVLLGLSQLVKYVCLLLYPIFIVLVLIKYSGDVAAMSRRSDSRGLARSAGAFLKYVLVFVIVSVVIINLGFLFDRSLTPLGQYEFRSEYFQGLQHRFAPLTRLPVPFPYPYLEGIDWGQFRAETGSGFGSMYLFGELRQVGGFKGYYLFAFLYKVPIAAQVLILLSLVLYITRFKREGFLENELFLLGPIVFFGLYFNLFFKLQIGIRHFLVVFPLLHVFCGSLFRRWGQWGTRLKVASWLLMIYLVISVLSYFPHYIPYFNELVWDRKQAYKILADSNIDWGQDKAYLKEYEEKYPDAYVEKGEWRMKRYRDKHWEEYLNPQFPDSGKIVVNVNSLVGIHDPHRYQWLREGYEPVGHIAHSYLVYEVSPRGTDDEE